MQKFTLDAENKKVGRVASEAAKLLMGKQTTSFVRNVAPDIHVEIINAAKADVPLKRRATVLKARASGYPSGMKIETVEQVINKKGMGELFHKAVSGMLPRNKLRSIMIKNLKITE